MTDPARLVVGNAVGVTTGERNGERVLREAVEADPFVVMVALVEADDVSRLDGPVLPPEWRVLHRGQHEDRDGCLLAYDRRRVMQESVHWSLGVTNDLPGLPRGAFRPRWLLTARLVIDHRTPDERRRKVLVGHLPLRSNGKAYRDEMFQRIRWAQADINAADWNSSVEELRQRFPSHDIRVPKGDVMGVVATRAAHVSRSRRVNLPGSDHHGMICNI